MHPYIHPPVMYVISIVACENMVSSLPMTGIRVALLNGVVLPFAFTLWMWSKHDYQCTTDVIRIINQREQLYVEI